MAQIAVAAVISVAVGGLQSLFAPKPKPGKVDRGRLGDIRFQTVEEGAFVPKVYGRRVRLAGNMFWFTPTQEHKTVTPGRSGGKGPGRPPEPETTTFSYTKSFAILICDALPGGANGRLRKIVEDTELIYSAVGLDEINGFREAEAAGNTLANGSLRTASTICSGGQAVSLPVFSAGVQFNSIDGPGAVDVTLYYISSGSSTLQVVINNVNITTLSLPSTGGEIGTHEFTVTFPALGNYLRFQGASTAIQVDRIHLRAAGTDAPSEAFIPTGALDPLIDYPADLDNPRPFYNVAPQVDVTTGTQMGTLVAGGQSPFEFYTGVETQLQSPTMVGIDGAENVSAHRGSCFWVADTYQLKGPNTGNFTFEIDPGMSDLADIMVDLYKQTSKLTESDLDMTALAGEVVESLIIESSDGLAGAIDALSVWYNFDVVDRGGKIVAVKRGGASVATITEGELAAYEEGGKRPEGPVSITYQPGMDAPGMVNVSFIDPSPGKDFHTATVLAQRSVGTSVEPETLDFPIGGTADKAVEIGLRYLYARDNERRPFEVISGPKFSHLLPTDVVTLQLASATHVLRLTQVQAALTGLVKMRGVPEKASVYDQARAVNYGSGAEIPPVDYPANSLLVKMDIPALRPEDDYIGTYDAVCKRGAGGWRGCVEYKEEIAGEYDRITSFDRQASIGVVENAVGPGPTTEFDRTTELVVNFYNLSVSLESRPEDDILARPVHLAYYDGEIIQFASAVPEAPTAPYVARYRISVLLRARAATEYAMDHDAGKFLVLLDDTVKFRREDRQELYIPRKFKAVTLKQALPDAPEYDFTLQGNSVKSPSPVAIDTLQDSLGNITAKWLRRARLYPGLIDYTDVSLGEENESYVVKWTKADGSTRDVPVIPRMALPCFLLDKYGEGAGNTRVGPTNLGDVIADARQEFGSIETLTESGNYFELTAGVARVTDPDEPSTNPYARHVRFALVGPSTQAQEVAEIPYAASKRKYLEVIIYGEQEPFAVEVLKHGVSIYQEPQSAENFARWNLSRVRFQISGSEMRLTRNYTGPGQSPPFLVLTLDPAQYPFRLWCAVRHGIVLQSIVTGGHSQPRVTYAAEQVKEDWNGVIPAVGQIAYSIQQISPLVGPGHAATGTV